MISGKRVAIVGGGVVGLAAAYYLERAGAEVVVVERAAVGGAASRGNAGWIVPSLSAPLPAPGVGRYALRAIGRSGSPLFIAPRLDPAFGLWLWRFWRHCNGPAHDAGRDATLRLNARTMALYDELKADGVEFSMWRQGLLFAFLDERSAAGELAALRALGEHGYALPDAPLDASALRRLEPALSDQVRAGFLLADERHVEPETLTRGLLDHLRRRGVTIRDGVEVTGFRVEGRRVAALRTGEGEELEADATVLAAGAWTTALARRLRLRLPVEAGKGYSFRIRPARPPAHPLYLGDAKIAVSPFGDGAVRVAGTLELSGLNLRVDRRRVEAIVAATRRFLDEWPEQAPEDPWVGMRPLSYDGLPVVGRPDGWDNLYVSTGHAALGVTLAPATGEALAELMATGVTTAALRPFSPTRFPTPTRNGDR